jgi:sugar phosphate isomerase/epimerase
MTKMFAGFHSVGLSQCSILTAINKVAAAGYKAIELNAETLPWADPHVTPQTPSDERAAIAAAAKQAGLIISAISAHVPMVDADY